MEIIESKIIGKQSQKTCEDGIVVTDDFIAVIDGSTSKGHFQINSNISNGRYCMLLVSDFIQNMNADISCKQFCDEMTSKINIIYKEHGLLDRLAEHATERLTSSAIVYSRNHEEVWMVGDCQCLIDGVFYDNPKPRENEIATMRANYISTELKHGKTIQNLMMEDTGRERILPTLIDSCQYQNISYATIDGFNIPMDKVKTIDTKNHYEIVLASDGYPFLCTSLRESEEMLKAQLNSDPLCIDTYKATKGLKNGNKSFDDRAYIRFKLT